MMRERVAGMALGVNAGWSGKRSSLGWCTGMIVAALVAGASTIASAADDPRSTPTQTATSTATAAATTLLTNPWLWINLAAVALVLGIMWMADVIRPRSLSRYGIRDVSPYPWWIWVVAAVITLVGTTLGQSFAALGLGITTTPTATRELAIIGVASYSTGIIVATVIAWLIHGSAPFAGFRPTWRGAMLGVLGAVLAWPGVTATGMILVAAHELWTGQPVPRLAHATLERVVAGTLDPWTMVLIGCAVIGAPILEELMYRGFVQSGILRATGRAWLSVLAASIFFGLMHVAGGAGMPWYAVAVVTVLSICMGAAFERTRDISTPLVMHILFNAGNVAMALLATGK
jgi:membrane protease YdiL (CAAX protease family)